jgi:hypothetical protein
MYEVKSFFGDDYAPALVQAGRVSGEDSSHLYHLSIAEPVRCWAGGSGA